MAPYLARRLLMAVPTLMAITAIAFVLTSAARGDAAAEALRQTGQEPTAAEVAAYRQQLGLDDPFLARYGRWLGALARGDLGTSFLTGRPVAETFRERALPTLQLGGVAMLVSSVVGVGLGIWFGHRRGSVVDRTGRFICFVAAALPSFWLALLLVTWIGERWSFVPVAGYGQWRHFLMPVVALSAGQIATLVRITRSSFLDAWHHDHVRTAQAKGLRGHSIVLRHVVPGALLPVVTVLGLRFGHLLAGSVVIETIFAWPGMGSALVSAISGRDLPVIGAYVLLAGTLFVMVNLLTDVLYVVLDPRVRLGESGSHAG